CILLGANGNPPLLHAALRRLAPRPQLDAMHEARPAGAVPQRLLVRMVAPGARAHAHAHVRLRPPLLVPPHVDLPPARLLGVHAGGAAELEEEGLAAPLVLHAQRLAGNLDGARPLAQASARRGARRGTGAPAARPARARPRPEPTAGPNGRARSSPPCRPR